ncbi:CDP-glucose 4,6-dehydratase [Ferruginibacter paludis]|uniref:CDP-glucose 4,6-dehydratase n=1 Tax=Ferruginibacter paludis TaxID=1310417 RepID=UPI0025B4DF31|nr:CDP-glucose 4,6-dehydratase [Ferruginibacter paludis]MDN3657166.1 CDP-glucose 4,6-dehydratase [Ferruginibacter paludis]
MESVVRGNTFLYYKGKKVFITGHTGFKGAWLITWLHLLGANIKGYALAPDDIGLFNAVAPHIEFENVIADIRDKEKLKKEILDFRPDFIFHLAAQALVRRSYEIPSETFDINTVGTANVLEAVCDLPDKCSVIVITTDKVYENKEIDYHYQETDELGGYDPYSASKAAAEIVINSFRRSFFNLQKYSTHQKSVVSARAGNVIGGGDWNKDRIIPDIIRSLIEEKPVRVRNPGAVRPWQHVLEPLSGYLLLGILLNDEPAKFSGAYNFGPKTDDHLSVKELVSLALEYWGHGSWADDSDPSQPHEAGILQLDISKAIANLKWTPKLTSKEAIEWTIEWYKQKAENVFEFTIQQIKNYQST